MRARVSSVVSPDTPGHLRGTLLLLLLATLVHAKPDGAPFTACTSLLPKHPGTSVQPLDSSPYQLSPSTTTYSPYSPVVVSINSQFPFQGVIVQARLKGTDTIVGYWDSVSSDSGLRLTSCSAMEDTVTHSNTNSKMSVRLTWTTARSMGDIEFVATVAASFSTYWVGIKSVLVKDASKIPPSTTAPFINPCVSGPCKNGGTCFNNGGTFVCVCPDDMMGIRCENDVRPRACQGITNPCANGGQCVAMTANTWGCDCRNGWAGTTCTDKIQPLSSTCFPASALVILANGSSVPMAHVQIGQSLLVVDHLGQLDTSPVITFLDRQTQGLFDFLHIETDDGVRVEMSPHHLVAAGEGRFIWAERLQPGDLLWYWADTLRSAKVVQVSLVQRRGAYAPLTMHGTLLVNNVWTSCYAILEDQTIAHMMMAPLRLLYRWMGPANSLSKGVHWYADVLRRVATTAGLLSV